MVDNDDLAFQKILGTKIASRRKSLNWTQEFLAQHMGVDTETISRFERGVTAPSLKSILKIAHLLSVSVSQLMDDYEIPQPSQSEIAAHLLEHLNQNDQKFIVESLRNLALHLSKKCVNS